MSSVSPDPAPTAAFSLLRWSARSSNSRPGRADLVISGGGREWRARATGNGAVDALLLATDIALAPVLGEGVELQTYTVHATGDGHDAAAVVTLTLRARSDDPHAPGYPGRGVHENILEASLVAYIDAINRLVAHTNVDVAAAAPPPDETDVPERDEEADAPERHKDVFRKMFNP